MEADVIMSCGLNKLCYMMENMRLLMLLCDKLRRDIRC